MEMEEFMFRWSRKRRPDRSDRIPDTAPRLIRITPDGRRIVDPMSIIGSEAFKRHLDEIKDMVPRRRIIIEP